YLGCVTFPSSLTIHCALTVGNLIRNGWSYNITIAIGLNARGGAGIFLPTITFGAGLISEPFFVALVLIAIVTSLMTGYWLRYTQAKGWPLLDEDKASQQSRF